MGSWLVPNSAEDTRTCWFVEENVISTFRVPQGDVYQPWRNELKTLEQAFNHHT
jgi:hypothetical protein